MSTPTDNMPFLNDVENALLEEQLAPITSDVVDGLGQPLLDQTKEPLDVIEEPGFSLATLENGEAELNENKNPEVELKDVPFAYMDDKEPPSSSIATKRRGRTATATPAKSSGSRTPCVPKSAKTSASTSRKRMSTATSAEIDGQDVHGLIPAKRGRKRKSEEIESKEEAAPAKRGRPSTSAAKSARSSVKEASKPKRGRPKASVATPTKATKGKAGRPKKSDATNGALVSTEEYEVEKILAAKKDGGSKEHLYRVKWKGYPESESTWEPKSNLTHASELIKEFNDKTKKPVKNTTPTKKTVVKQVKKPGRKPAASKPGRKPAGRPRRKAKA